MDVVFGSDRVFATTRRVVVYKHNFMTFRSCVLCYQLSPMWSSQILFVLQFILLTCVLGDGTYECGDHGRFEYCIDEIPGCVIGCHCHPGYYFDTDTKICEPNTKLIEHYRRDSALKTTRGQKIEVTPNTLVYDTEPAFSTDKIDGSVDELTKDANDLGDWLYNQFFKTIENQVINNTNDKGISTRRGASQPKMKIPKRNKKSRKGKSSKQKGKKEQLRRKLLRITENDSLFDISSKSSSDSSDSSSSGDSSSMEYEINENNHHEHEDGEHGHKKIVMINKKPKQPLPSFIFLPNLDTPFYPPIGLPPPPIVPMYPMVPVPPVPLCPITGCIDNINVATTSSAPNTITAQAATTTSISTVPTNTTIPSSVPETTADAIATEDTITSDVPITDTRALRLKNKKKKKAAKLLNNDTSKADTEQGLNGLKYFERQKILERLKEKMGNPSAKLFMGPWKKNKKIYSNKFMDQNVDTESQFLDNEIVDNELLNNERNQKLMREGSFPDNVDFRYITELIHRVDLNNKTNDLPPIEYNPLDSIELQEKQFSDYSVPLYTPDGRRTSHPKHHKSDESYYANLGRQIATMIRGIDKQENAELVETSNNIKNDPYLKNNSPTSFWERFVRSPLAYLKTNKNKKFEYLKRSNELLFDIENKVEVIASTAASLTLQEIENVVKVMEDAKKKIQSKNKSSMKNPETSRKNLNIDLWPQKSRNSRDDFQNSVLPYFNKIRQEKNANNYETNKSNIAKPNVDLPGLRMHSSQKFVAWNGTNFNKIIKLINQTYKIPTIATPLFNKKYTQNNYNSENTNKIHQIPALANQFSQNTIKQSFPNQQVNPYLLHHRRYFQDNSNNYYVNRNVELSYFSPVKRITGVPQLYFPEINHFDYID